METVTDPSLSDQIELETPRLLLRAATPADADALFEAFRDPEVMRYWSEPPHPSAARTAAWLAAMIASPHNGRADFLITLRTTRQIIGKIGVWQGREVGFLLARAHWGRGLAREAVECLLGYLFGDEVGGAGSGGRRREGEEVLSEVVADIDPRNEASRRLLKKMGFEKTGFEERTLLVGEEWVDSEYWGLKRARWVERRIDERGGGKE